MEGKKDDSGKHQWGLVPWGPMREVVEVLMHGAEHYGAGNWQFVEPWQERYFDAAIRHLIAWHEGELNDGDTGKSHLAHAICCLLFMMGRSNGG